MTRYESSGGCGGSRRRVLRATDEEAEGRNTKKRLIGSDVS